MSFYRINKGFDSPWCNDDFYKLQESRVYEEKIVMNRFWENNETILLLVRNLDEATDNKDWEYQDFFVWKLSSPNAYTLIVSNKMREIIDKNLSLPPHRYYDCTIENYRLQESSAEYSVLHFIHDYYEEINYQESKFGVIDALDDRLIGEVPMSEIKSEEDNIKIEAQQRELVWSYVVRPLKLSLTKGYDIVGINNIIYISPKAYQLFIDNNLSGIDFLPYTKATETVIPEIIYKNEI